MPKSKIGVLLKTDVATNIYLRNEAKPDRRNNGFLIMPIDDKHLFVEENKLDWIREKVREFKENYNWKRPNDAPDMFAEQ